ncbi:MAG: kelch repeat-containing protein, partial [Terriglobales bacterium]
MLVTGGTTASGITNSAEIYDPATGSWSSAGAMAESLTGHTASALPDGTVLLAGGQNSSGPSSTLEIFDPTATTFAYAGNLRDARQNHAAATLQDGRILLVGGTSVAADGSATVLKSAEIYDPVLKEVSSASPLNIARASHSLTTLVDGTVVAIGGNDGTSDLASAEVYQPASDSWQLVSGSALATARSQHLAFLLPKNNGVLIAGGKSSGADLSAAEIFQSWTATFQATGSMSVARSGAIGSPLTQDGMLLVAGGSNQSSAEAYGFATVKTDKSDYSPGQTVTITGKGWQPGETVTLLLHEVPLQHADRTLTAVADAFGNFQNTSFQPEVHDLDVRFFMTVTGARSQAQITFTDAGPLDHFAVTAPATATANNGFSVTVKAKDSGGSNVTTYTGTVHFTSSDPQAVLPADYTFVAADSGSHNFSAVKLRTAGSQTITVTDTSDATKFGSGNVTVTAAAAKQLLVSWFPSSISAGTANDVTVTAQDNFGNVATGYTGTVHFTSSDSQAVLPADYTFVAADNGAHIFSLGATLRTAGTQSITATDTVTASINGSQTGITVTSSTASTLAVSGYPATTNAGDGNKLTVTAKDSFGNTATGYTGTVHFTSSDPQANLPSDYTFTTGTGADNGVHAFNAVKLKTAGSQSISATDTVTATITGTQSGITVNPGPAKVLSVAGFPSGSTAGTAQNFAVTAQDQFGNTATAYTGAVHFTSSDPQAGLPADYTFVAGDNGVHSFTATLKTAAAESLTATDTVTATITGAQSGIAVNPAAAASFTLAYGTPAVAGTGNPLTVTANDAYGNTATGYLGTVHFTSSDPQAVLPADYTFLITDKGTTKLTQVKLKTVGTQSITATDTVTATITGTVSGISVTPGPVKVLAVSAYPSPATAGTSNNFTVTAQDNFGNTASGYTGTVRFTSSDAQAVLPADYTFVAGDNSVHSFSATLKTAATQTIVATDTVTATITGSQSVTVNAAPASILVLAFPTPTVAGDNHNLTVTAQDPYGNTATGYAGTVHVSSSDPQAALPADYTFVPATDSGTHKFSNTKLKTVGTQSFTATDTVTATITGTVAGITVTPGPAKILIVSGFPSPATAGVSSNVIVTAQDSFGNTATGYTGTVHLTSSDAQAVLPADYTFVAADAGVHTFSTAASLRTAGSQSITATDTLTATITGTQSGITVTGAAAATLTLTFPTPVVAGVGNRLTVAAKDAFGNVATGYVGTVHFTSSDAQANLPADYTFVAGDAGTHNFNTVKLKTAGTQSIGGTDLATPTITGTVTGIVVTGAAAATLAVTGYPSPATEGVSNNFTGTALDSFGNTAAGYLGTVHFTSSDTAAVLPADYTFVAGDNSAHVFSATLITAGKQSITATDTVTATITGAESGIKVSSGPAAKLKVTGYPSPATAGVSNSFTVTAKDANGNTVAEYVGAVHFTSSDAQAVLPADYTFQAADAGAHTFSATLKTSGTQSITATDTSNPSINDTQKNIVVGGGTATVLAVSGYPSPATAGVSSSFTVTAKDGFGNVAVGYTGTVHFTSTDPQAVLPADYAFQAADAGAHTFSATLKTAGTQSITATDTTTGSIIGSQSVTVNSGPAALLVVKGYPSPATAGVSSSFNVCAKDGFGNTATTYTGTVHFTSSDSQAVLPADYTFQTADAGVHNFSATMKTSGTQAIAATDISNGSITGTQSNISVGGGAATVLVVSGYPSPATAGLSGSFTVTAKDGLGNLAPAYTGTVHFTSSDA